ncbi:hypothetical protein Tco_1184467 [Tanacetum coccineum]
MAVLDSCPKHNMVAYLEKTEGNAEFHEIINFLKRAVPFNIALTRKVLVVSTTFVEQFWTSAKSKIINNVRYITAKVAGKSVSIFEASIRTVGESHPLFAQSWYTEPTDEEGSTPSRRPSKQQPDTLTCSSLTFTLYYLPLLFQKTSGEELRFFRSSQEIPTLEAQIKNKRFGKKRSTKKQRVHKESVSKQGRKFAKGEPSVHRDPLFDEISGDTLDHIETENAQVVGRTRDIVNLGLTSTRSLSGPYSLLILPKIDPKDKGKKKIEEEDESDGIPEAEKKFKQLASDEEMARKMQEEWESEEERNRIAEEKATNEALIRNFDDIKARIEADRLLAEKLQEQEREQFTIEERAKFLHDTIAAQRKFLAQQRSEAIRNRPPTKNQLRNQMMTYLKALKNRIDEPEITFIQSSPDEEKEVDYEILDRRSYQRMENKTEIVFGTSHRKVLLVQMLKLKLESEEDSTMALELIRFVKILLAELEPEDSDGDEEDL